MYIRRKREQSRPCRICGTPFTFIREDARYCSAKCRKACSRNILPVLREVQKHGKE